jgi:hypothetical protein
MARLQLLALPALALLATAACDDYYADYPPATPADVPQVPVDPTAQQPQDDSYKDTDPSALTDFHSTLDAHGQWVEDPTYGTVWSPNPAEVGADFAPYETAGHWAYDDADYVWMSDYDWGWAPFHYGRWVLSDSGWVWIPGREYAPAWVYWQMGYPGYPYVGWGPMYPGYIWRGGYAVGYVAVAPPAHFYYAAQGAIFEPHIAGAVIVGPQAGVIGALMGYYGGGGAVGGQVAVAPAAGGARVASAPAAGGAPAGGHVASAPPAGAAMHGPAPASLGIPAQNVAHVPPGDKGSMMAKNFAKPSTATAMGAHPPAKQVAKSAPKARPCGGYHGGSHGGGFHGGGHR